MESRSGDHGRGLKQLPVPWTTSTPAGHNFSLGAAGCFPWPAQMRSPPMSSSSCYTCGYCRREFRSAQALGGHMNVHRRDRARLRQQCCSAAAAAHGPSSSSLPSPGMVTEHHQHSRAPPLPNFNFSPPHRTVGTDPVIYSFFSATTTTSAAAVATSKAALEVSLEPGIGVCGSGSGSSRGGGVLVEEDGLDLELRLGCAWE